MIPETQVMKQRKGGAFTVTFGIKTFPTLVLCRDETTAFYTGLFQGLGFVACFGVVVFFKSISYIMHALICEIITTVKMIKFISSFMVTTLWKIGQ